MQPWVQLVLIACAVALTAALVAAVLALRGALRRTEAVLQIVEQELRPLIGQAHGITQEVRELTHEARLEVVRVGEVTAHRARDARHARRTQRWVRAAGAGPGLRSPGPRRRLAGQEP